MTGCVPQTTDPSESRSDPCQPADQDRLLLRDVDLAHLTAPDQKAIEDQGPQKRRSCAED